MFNIFKLLKLYKRRHTIKKSGLFDEIYYLKSYPDVRAADIDPIEHYILFGAKERRNPNIYFQTGFYLDKYPDMVQSGINPLLHYILFGAKEGRWPNPEFDSEYYLLANPDVKKARLNPLLHYILFGQKEGRKTKGDNVERSILIHNEPAKPITLLRLINRANVKKGINYIRMYGLKEFSRKVKEKLLSRESLETDKLEKENCLYLSEVMELLLPEPFVPKISITKPIDILIPIYNGREFLDSLFASIVKNTFVPYRLLIANDKSTDPSISKYLPDFKNSCSNIDITIVENEDNLGFVKTVNKLAKLTKNHFVILNTDTEVPPHWLERLIFSLITKDNVASVTPFTNAGTICSFPEFCIDNSLFEDMDVATLDSYFQYVNFEKNYVEIPTAVGFCMAINKKVYDKIGLFDENFGKGYGEENDWSMRAAKLGYKNIIVPNLFVYHKHGGSFPSEEKKRLMENNAVLLKNKHPDYFFLVEDFIKKDPLKFLRTILKLKILSTIYKPVMILDHALGGGANEYTNSLVADKPLAIIIRYDLKVNKYFIELCGQKIEKSLFRLKDITEINHIIKFFNVEEIIINELVSYPKVLDLLAFLIEIKEKNKDIKYTFMLHDFFCICPMYNLLNYEVKYCNVPVDLNQCAKCLKLNPLIEEQVAFVKNDYPNLTISLWRKQFSNLLDYSSKIICFSQKSKKILQKVYPNLSDGKFEIKHHIVDWVRPVVVNNTSETINIATIGHMTIHKGAHIVSSLATYVDYHNINIKIHIFGDIFEPYESFNYIKTVIKHGRYKKEDLPKLMEENEIDIIFIPSIWPETFSFTTEEAIKMELPLAVFDLGAPAERVKIYDKGIILQKQDPEYIISTLFNYFNKKFG
ncbi:glycosyl transferase family 2 [Thermodesulfobium narugense DSM 14796]|uniref:Glycosyl transferase family 2 n=1 Tax=Thermodesulfobium narugense DSM 14796 TaxID=747365 RepID=M1E554_9BACT|nr:glycosyltransferase [Thermodesulfobium narugense]AEE14041.1 glycosyl transferase family 2 [Thermodesulfobium narugense DSM 14796]